MIYVDRYYKSSYGKTAHGLVRCSRRYKIECVVDSTINEGDAGEILDGIKRDIPLFNKTDEAYESTHVDTVIVGAASDGGVLPEMYDETIKWALNQGLNIVSGLHQFISDNPVFSSLAKKNKCSITDVRKIFRDYKRFYTGEIKQVDSLRIPIIGTDSAIGKRTLAVMITEELNRRGRKADMIYTGQTGWLQGWPHGVVLDAMINDFIPGGIEGAILDSWKDEKPEFMLIEGQGSLLHPVYPSGLELLVSAKVNGFILVDAPRRPHLDGFPDYPMPDPGKVIKIAELLTDEKLLGIGLNHENMKTSDIDEKKEYYSKRFKVTVIDPLIDGVDALCDTLEDEYDSR